MTDPKLEIRIRLAVAMGYVPTDNPDASTDKPVRQVWAHPKYSVIVSTPYAYESDDSDGYGHDWKDYRPDTDLNAMSEVEQVITERGLQDEYAIKLHSLVGLYFYSVENGVTQRGLFLIATASAHIRALAALHVLEQEAKP